jgi:hypothetical protein
LGQRLHHVKINETYITCPMHTPSFTHTHISPIHTEVFRAAFRAAQLQQQLGSTLASCHKLRDLHHVPKAHHFSNAHTTPATYTLNCSGAAFSAAQRQQQLGSALAASHSRHPPVCCFGEHCGEKQSGQGGGGFISAFSPR